MLSRAEQIIAAVSKETGVSRDAILAPTRSTRETAWARMGAVFICRELTGASWSELGRVFGRDRTTTRHAYQTVSKAQGVAWVHKVKHECAASTI